MSNPKTKPTNLSVSKYIKEITNSSRKVDARIILTLMKKITGKKPILWGESIIGFGQYHYKYTSGREGDWPITGFSVRKSNLVIYIMPGFTLFNELMSKLGKYNTGSSCLYIKKLVDIDLSILEKLICASVKEMKKRYECN
jgi:hypothetical protein